MTSSHRATGVASVRATPVDAITTSGPWALAELSLPSVSIPVVETAPAPPEPMVTPEMIAAERARWVDEGYARGLADGERRGIAATQAQTTQATALLADATRQLEQLATLAPAVLEDNIAALAVTIARQLIAHEVTHSADLVADLVRRALTEFPIDQSVRIRVNPMDLSLMTAATSSREAGPITGTRDASWLADPRIARGGCLVEGRDRIVDGRVDTALERAYRCMVKLDAN